MEELAQKKTINNKEFVLEKNLIDTNETNFRVDNPSSEIQGGTDQRRPITETELGNFPYKCICKLRIVGNRHNSPFGGTGTFISPNCVVTAAHNVVNNDELGGPARSIEVIPALYGDSMRYGTTIAADVQYPRKWAELENINPSQSRPYDYAVIFTKDALGSNTGYMNLITASNELQNSNLSVVGYPIDLPDNQYKGKVQYTHSSTPSQITERLIFYMIDTKGGQSGSPVMVRNGDTYNIVGIHSGGNLTEGNRAAKINSDVYDTIRSWIN
jgi:V8-like Glu-specific endopeptidase